VPNAGHSLRKTDAVESLQAFYTMVVEGRERPEVRWSLQPDGTIKATTTERPQAVRLWQAVNPKARNFRFDAIGAAYKDTPLEPTGPNTWVARVPAPPAGWTAFFVEFSFPSGGPFPLKTTTGVRVLPETLPYPPPEPPRGGGQTRP
jgi:PhoPQ-activated pathogenicity-related protein